MFLLQNMDVCDKVIIIADTRHTQRWSERKINPTLCEGDLAFFCNCPMTQENLRLWAQERTPGIPRNVGAVNSRIRRRSWLYPGRSTLDSMRSGMFHGYGR